MQQQRPTHLPPEKLQDLLVLHAVVRVAHDGDQQVEQDNRHDQDVGDEKDVGENRLRGVSEVVPVPISQGNLDDPTETVRHNQQARANKDDQTWPFASQSCHFKAWWKSSEIREQPPRMTKQGSNKGCFRSKASRSQLTAAMLTDTSTGLYQSLSLSGRS